MAFRCQANETFFPLPQCAMHTQHSTDAALEWDLACRWPLVCCCSAGQGSVIRPGPVAEERGFRFRASSGGMTEYVGRDKQRRDHRAMDAARPGEGRRCARATQDDETSDVWMVGGNAEAAAR